MRGTTLPESAPTDLRSRQETAQLYDQAARAAFDEEAIARRVRADRALGFLTAEHAAAPRHFSLADLGIAGGYDPETKAAFVVNDLELVGRDDRTRAHEIAHVLDDWRFDLQKMCLEARGNSDRALAVRALIEGSAMTMALDFVLADSFEDTTGSQAGAIVSRTQEELESDLGLFGRVHRQARKWLSSTPRYLRERIVFPYARGFELVRVLRMQGGTAYVDAAFENPPRSTEQVLHPEKLVDRRDDPVAIEIATPWLPQDAETIHEDTLGEFGMRQLLALRLPKRDVWPAAAGWGGDRFRVVGVGGRDVVLWHTEWDTERDAREFGAAVHRFFAARYHTHGPWMIEQGWGELTRPDGFVVQVRRRGRSVSIVDGVPAIENWADALLDTDGVVRVDKELRGGKFSPLGLIADRDAGPKDTVTRVLGGIVAHHHARNEASSFRLLGGALADVQSSPDGTRVSLLFGLVSWRTAPRQELFSGRLLVSSFAEDTDRSAWWLLPLVNAPGRIRALGHNEVRTGLWNLDRTHKVTFADDGRPTEGHQVGSDGSVLLGLFGHGWYEDEESDGTPVKSSTWYGPFPIGFSTTTQSRGPLGPAYAVKPESAPSSGPASRERIRLQPGDVEEYSHTQVLGDLLFAHDRTTLTRDGAPIGNRALWSLLFGLLASGGARDRQWWFRNPLVGWAELTDRSYLLLFWGFVPILISSSEAPSETQPAAAAGAPASNR